MDGAGAGIVLFWLSLALLLLLPDRLGQLYRSPVSDNKYLYFYPGLCTVSSCCHVSGVLSPHLTSPVVLVLFDPVSPVSPPSPSPPVAITVTVDDVPGRPQLAVPGLHPGADDERLGGHEKRLPYILVAVSCNINLSHLTSHNAQLLESL